jgi:hypothetical protein
VLYNACSFQGLLTANKGFRAERVPPTKVGCHCFMVQVGSIDPSYDDADVDYKPQQASLIGFFYWHVEGSPHT